MFGAPTRLNHSHPGPSLFKSSQLSGAGAAGPSAVMPSADAIDSPNLNRPNGDPKAWQAP